MKPKETQCPNCGEPIELTNVHDTSIANYTGSAFCHDCRVTVYLADNKPVLVLTDKLQLN